MAIIFSQPLLKCRKFRKDFFSRKNNKQGPEEKKKDR